MIKKLLNDLKTTIVLIICYCFISKVEMAVLMYYNYTPIDALIVIILIFNLAFAGFLTDYLI